MNERKIHQCSPERYTQTDHLATTVYRQQKNLPQSSYNYNARSEPGIRYLIPVSHSNTSSSRKTDQLVNSHEPLINRMSISSSRSNDQMVLNTNTSTKSYNMFVSGTAGSTSLEPQNHLAYTTSGGSKTKSNTSHVLSLQPSTNSSNSTSCSGSYSLYFKPSPPIRSISQPTTAEELAIHQSFLSPIREPPLVTNSYQYNQVVVKPVQRSRHITKHRKQKTDMSVCENRIKTYYDYTPSWPHLSISIVSLSNQGFYYIGIEDICQCFQCEVKIENWSSEDDPLKRHMIESPNCTFIRETFLKEIEAICNVEYREFVSIEKRIASFFNWPLSRKLPGYLLAQNGWFYTGRDIITKCFQCGYLYDAWKPGDDPLLVHKEKCKQCSFLKEKQQEGDQSQQSSQTPAITIMDTAGINYNTKDARLQSFDIATILLKDISIDKEEFVEAGFYLIKTDVFTVKCFSCCLIVSDWSRGEDPYIKHLKLKPDCEFIEKLKINKQQPQLYHDDDYEKFKSPNEARNQKITSLSDDLIKRKGSASSNSSNAGYMSLPASTTTKEEIEEEDGKYCTVCLCNKKEYAIVPCGHLCVCGECSVMLTQCPLCRCTKQGVLKIYNS